MITDPRVAYSVVSLSAQECGGGFTSVILALSPRRLVLLLRRRPAVAVAADARVEWPRDLRRTWCAFKRLDSWADSRAESFWCVRCVRAVLWLMFAGKISEVRIEEGQGKGLALSRCSH